MGRESAVDTYSATQDRSSCSYTLSRQSFEVLPPPTSIKIEAGLRG
jgi:hypothetical protein